MEHRESHEHRHGPPGSAVRHDASGDRLGALAESQHADHDEHNAHADHGSGAVDHAAHGHGAHDKHAGHSPAMFRDRFWLSLVLTIPVVLTSDLIMEWFGYELDFAGMKWVAPVLGTVVFFYGGLPFVKGAI